MHPGWIGAIIGAIFGLLTGIGIAWLIPPLPVLVGSLIGIGILGFLGFLAGVKWG